MRLGGIIYLVIGIFVAVAKDYVGELDGIGEFINLLLAIVLWPLVLVGVKFSLHFGGGDKDKNDALGSAFVLVGPAVAYGRAALSSMIRTSR
jgi:hypothetical protein